MNKNVMIILGVLLLAVIGWLIFRYLKTPSQVYSPVSLNPYTSSGGMTTANHQAYPFVPNSVPRADNSNQPWYKGDRSILTQGGGIDLLGVNINDLAQGLGDLSSILDSGSNIYSQISGWFSNDTANTVNFDVMDFKFSDLA